MIPVLVLVALFVASPILACEAMARSQKTSAPMDMAGGCTDNTPDGSLVLCPSSAMIAAATPQVELPGYVAITPTPPMFAASRFGSVSPTFTRPEQRPPGAVPLYKFYAIYLI